MALFHVCLPHVFKDFPNMSMFLAPPVSAFQTLTNPLVSLIDIVHRALRCFAVMGKNGEEAHNFA